MSRREDIASALRSVRDRLDAACRAAGRDPAAVAMLPVTKFFPVSDVHILYELGCREFGESREPEASTKVAEFRTTGASPDEVRWHMIGRLQRNKVKSVVRWADVVHSADSSRLVDTLDAAVADSIEAGGRTRRLDVLLQVSLDADPARGGVPVAELAALADRVESAPSLNFRGLMAVPPLDSDPARAFEQLAAVHADLLRTHPRATELSAGMTGDLEAAVAHGSTCVRVGTALLGSRPIASK
ncbi:YggS family pyridoxal phosphate-dependent enzyme [Rhodococcus sp. ABRD24]|uniref:YggS family pyridoxal phosphate-dependent enzyme n=1 Tax=Rhodococcus sp. ABRD24 TaxID=2507582 RepID=UPI00103D0B68|nr:YggS family pyridoxal phosphate-dependent enzyme [Rhodococcus sp. ABRD24]QBJ94863.1 YggS family pyridoxal phosphate-dependent enzyme [Rhodococcus sp. ABRD24]